jgi:UDP-2,4-diacetamido-2,4,6-trideoxy-beta-L-altropyranose hydrolase
MPPPLLIRADASPRIGTGHVLRSLALAHAWTERGAPAMLAASELPPKLAARWQQEAGPVHTLPTAAGTLSDAKATIALAREHGAAWTVLDGYSFNTRFQQELRDAKLRVLVIDDFGYCDRWSADVLLNQNPHAPEQTYPNLEPHCRLLRGPAFALLRHEFRRFPPRLRPPGPVTRLLVTLGGADPDNATCRVLECLNQFTARPLEVRVLIGAANPHAHEVEMRAHAAIHRVECLTAVDDMTPHYDWAEGVISAAGSTCYEWLYYRLPAVVLVIAANQRPIACALEAARAAFVCWDTGPSLPTVLQPALDQLLAGHQDLACLDQATIAVDGFGAPRVTAVLAGEPLFLRNATRRDLDLTFRWANDPVVRSQSFHSQLISLETHQQWFHNLLARSNARLYLAELPGRATPVGQVRFQQDPGPEWIVGILIAPEHRGHGHAAHLLRLGIARLRAETDPTATFLARIKPDNTASLHLFATAGFRSVQRAPDSVTLELPPEPGP